MMVLLLRMQSRLIANPLINEHISNPQTGVGVCARAFLKDGISVVLLSVNG